jgi:hypothetical protein
MERNYERMSYRRTLHHLCHTVGLQLPAELHTPPEQSVPVLAVNAQVLLILLQTVP